MSGQTPQKHPERRLFDTGFAVLIAVTLASGAGVVVLRGWDRFGEIVLHTAGFIAVLSPKILAGVFIAAALPFLLPRDRVALWIGQESGARGLVLATLAGAVVPGGPSMSMVLAAGFLTAGADLGSTLAFVTSWSLLSLNRTLIWEFSFLPADIVSFRLAASVAFPLLVGFAVRALARRRAVAR